MKSPTYIAEITTQKNEKYLSEGRNPLACSHVCQLTSCQLRNFPHECTEKCFAILKNQAAWFISRGISRSYFSRNFLQSFLLWYDFKILVKSRGGGTFSCLASSVLTFGRSNFFFNWKLNILSFIFLIWTKQFWIWLSWKFSQQKLSKFPSFLKFFLIAPPVWHSNDIRSDLSINNIVQLGSADTKISSQDAVKKVLELTEMWKYPNVRGKFLVFFKTC